MKLILTLLTALSLTGCGTMMEGVASYYNSQDPCQRQNWPENGGKMNMSSWGERGAGGYPVFCGAGRGSVYVSSYVRSNGVSVRSHTRSAPDGNPYNNLGSR
jgi:hypothetical protein